MKEFMTEWIYFKYQTVLVQASSIKSKKTRRVNRNSEKKGNMNLPEASTSERRMTIHLPETSSTNTEMGRVVRDLLIYLY